jgi:hypothetical protein
MSHTVHLASSFSLAAGQTVVFSDAVNGVAADNAYAYVLGPSLFPMSGQPVTFNLAGDVDVINTSPLPTGGIEDGYSTTDAVVAASFIAGSKVTIASTGTLNVSQSTTPVVAAPWAAVGYTSNNGFMSFENDGTVTVTSVAGFVYGVDIGTGSSTADAPHPSVVNIGTSHVSGPSGAGVWAGNGVILTNSGLISVQGGAYGVYVGSSLAFAIGSAFHTGVSIANSGAITVTGGSSPTVGIAVSNGYGGEVDIANSGSITADHAVEVISNVPGNPLAGGGDLVQLNNSGTLQGAVLVNSGTGAGAQIYNSGAIVGDVQLLSGGSDLYDGRGGTLSGTLTLGGGHATVYLGADGERVQGGSGGAVILGGPGIDTIIGGSGNDVIDGGGGSGDLLVGGTADVLDGGGGVNTVSFASSAFSVGVSLNEQGGFQDTGVNRWVSLTNFQNLTGSTLGDILIGNAGNNVIDGGGGGDRMDGGGGGVDTASYASATTGVTVSLALQGQAQATGVGSDTLTGFQNLTGSAFNDTLEGIAGSVLNGGGGSDTASFAHAAGATVLMVKRFSRADWSSP